MPVAMVTFTDVKDVTRALDEGFLYDGLCMLPVMYAPKKVPMRCYTCQKYDNHTANFCKNIVKCVNCAESHDTKSCPNPTVRKCSNCGDAHKADSPDCPNFVAALNNLTFLRQV